MSVLERSTAQVPGIGPRCPPPVANSAPLASVSRKRSSASLFEASVITLSVNLEDLVEGESPAAGLDLRVELHETETPSR